MKKHEVSYQKTVVSMKNIACKYTYKFAIRENENQVS